MNLVILHGRLTKEAELKTASNTQFCKFSIAVQRDFKREGQPEADFFNCTAFGKMSETISKYVHKGDGIVVRGRLQNDTWDKNGEKRILTNIIVDGFDFAEKNNASQTINSSNNNAQLNEDDCDDDLLPF